MSHDCTQEKIESGIPIIEIKVFDEKGIKHRIEENDGELVPPPTPQPVTPYYHFSHTPNQPPDPTLIRFYNFDRNPFGGYFKNFDRFALMADGRIVWKEDYVTCGERETKHFKESILEIDLLSHYRQSNKISLLTFGRAYALLHNLPARHCVFCLHYSNCRVPVEVEELNPQTKQPEKVKKMLFNNRLKENQVDKIKMANTCRNWNLDKAICKYIINSFPREWYFIWEAPL